MDGPAPGSFAGDGTGRPAYVVSIGSASKSFWGGLRVGWVRAHPDLVDRHRPPRGRTSTSARRSSSSWSWPSCSRTPTSSSPAGVRRCGTAATCSSASCSTSCRRGGSRCPRAGCPCGPTSGAPVSSALAAISRPARRARGARHRRSGWTAASSGTCACRSPTTADDLRRAVDGLADAWAGPGRHRARRGTRRGPRDGVTRQVSGSVSVAVACAPSCSRPTAWTPCAASVAPVLAEPLLGVVLRGEDRAHGAVEHGTVRTVEPPLPLRSQHHQRDRRPSGRPAQRLVGRERAGDPRGVGRSLVDESGVALDQRGADGDVLAGVGRGGDTADADDHRVRPEAGCAGGPPRRARGPAPAVPTARRVRGRGRWSC